MADSASDAILLRLKWRLAFNGWERKLARWADAVKAGFDPNQPRVPAGNPDGGQWTGTGGSSGGTGRILSDATPDIAWKPGSRVAQAGRSRGPNSTVRFGGRTYDATPGQAARYSAADARASAALRRVREIDPEWKPRPSLAPPQSAEGAIAIRRGEAREAEARLRELARQSSSDLIRTYRRLNNSRDLFGRETWRREDDTVAVTSINRTPYFSVNSNAPTYTERDRRAAQIALDTLIAKYPERLSVDHIGRMPNNALYHAEATILLRAARPIGGRWPGERSRCAPIERCAPVARKYFLYSGVNWAIRRSPLSAPQEFGKLCKMVNWNESEIINAKAYLL